MYKNYKIAFINKCDYLEKLNFDFTEIVEKISLKELNKINKISDFTYIFIYENNILYLKNCTTNLPAICCDFEDKTINYRLQTTGKKNELIKACGITKNNNLTIIDATAGMGKDSFILASFGAKIIMLEENPLIFTLLQNGLQRGKNSDNELIKNICNNMQLYNINAINFLKNYNNEVNCIYLDPMFPETNKTSLVKKEMQIFHNLAYFGNNAELLSLALQKTKARVVVKRMLKNEYLTDLKPQFQIFGSNIRFDVYQVIKKHNQV